MKFLYYATFCVLFCLFSCKSSKDISSVVLMSHLQGDIDYVIVSNYSDWNYDKQEGIDLLQSTKTFYDPKGYITRIEETYSDSVASMVVSTTNYKYDTKQRLIEKEIITFDSIGGIKDIQIEKLVNRVANADTWKVNNDTEVRTFDNDMENITFLTDSGTVESGLTYYKQYLPNGQLLKMRLSSNHIAVIDSYTYNPTSGFLLKKR